MALMTIQTDLRDINKGDLLVAGCAVVYACHILLLGHFAGTANLGVLIVTQIATGMGVGAATFWWAEPIRVAWTVQCLGRADGHRFVRHRAGVLGPDLGAALE